MTDPATITMMVDTGKTWPVPRSLITDILPAMTDLNELHVVLAMLRLVLDTNVVLDLFHWANTDAVPIMAALEAGDARQAEQLMHDHLLSGREALARMQDSKAA